MSHSPIAARLSPRAGAIGDGLLRLGLRLVMPLADFVVATFMFVVVVTGLALSVGLLPLFFLGVPVFYCVGWLARAMAAFERQRMRLFLDIEIPRPLRQSRRLLTVVRDRWTWRSIGYFLVQFPLATLTFAVTYAGLGAALAMMSMPWWLHQVPAHRADLWLFSVTDQWCAWWTAVLGVAIGVVALGVTIALTTAAGGLAKVMLGVPASELARQVDDLRGSRARVVDAAEAERRRIERDLHDGAQQRLVALAMNLGRAKARYDTDPDAARRLLEEAHDDAKQALVELRDLARGLHPAVLTDRGLDAALSGLAGRSPIPVTLDVVVEPRCSRTIEAIAYFVVSEALANAAKHSAASRVDIVARRVDQTLRVSISDDGVGGAAPHPGSGLAGLADRVGGVDGVLDISSPIGGPTVVTVELPCASS